MSINADQLLKQVSDFMRYHSPEMEREMPESALAEYIALGGAIDEYLAGTKPKPVAKKKAKKKVSKKK